MDFSLLPPMALFVVTGLLKLFSDQAIRNRVLKKVLEEKDEQKKVERLIRIAGNKSFREQSFAGFGMLPAIILTFVGDIPTWVVWSTWFFVFSSLIVTLAMIASPKYNGEKDNLTVQLWITLPLLLLSIAPLMATIIYAVYRAMSLL